MCSALLSPSAPARLSAFHCCLWGKEFGFPRPPLQRRNYSVFSLSQGTRENKKQEGRQGQGETASKASLGVSLAEPQQVQSSYPGCMTQPLPLQPPGSTSVPFMSLCWHLCHMPLGHTLILPAPHPLPPLLGPSPCLSAHVWVRQMTAGSLFPLLTKEDGTANQLLEFEF